MILEIESQHCREPSWNILRILRDVTVLGRFSASLNNKILQEKSNACFNM